MAKRQRSYLFEMPYQVDAPILTDEASGIDRVLLRCRGDRPICTITLIDTSDERLSRAGILLAHRVVEQRGEWVLQAPDWQPWLPADYSEPLDLGDELPEDLAGLLCSFRRRAAIGPVASVTVERACYVLLDVDGAEIGEVRDDRTTVRRGGLAVSRHRDVTFTPDDQMTSLQRSVVIERLAQSGGVKVAGFGEPLQRLVAITHPQPHPQSVPKPAKISGEDYLTWLFTDLLDAVLCADLRVRKNEVSDTALLADEVSHAAGTVRGLDCVIDPAWSSEFVWNADKVAKLSPRSNPAELGDPYFAVLDLLAQAIRAPRLRPVADDDEAPDPSAPGSARRMVKDCAVEQLAELVAAADSLTTESGDHEWTHALGLAQGLARTLQAGEPVLGKLRARMGRVASVLSALAGATVDLDDPGSPSIADMTPAQAYQAGRDYQRSLDRAGDPRREFCDSWPKVRARIMDEWPELNQSKASQVKALLPGPQSPGTKSSATKSTRATRAAAKKAGEAPDGSTNPVGTGIDGSVNVAGTTPDEAAGPVGKGRDGLPEPADEGQSEPVDEQSDAAAGEPEQAADE